MSVRGDVLVIDNEDSFTWNLVHLLEARGAEVSVRRHDHLDPDRFDSSPPPRVLVSPGPGRPEDYPATLEVMRRALRLRLPLLGICLGHQALAYLHGGRVHRAPAPVHGRSSLVRHDGRGLFHQVPDPLVVTRYHSLVVDPASLVASPLDTTAWTIDDQPLLMGLRHRELPAEGWQFHPESFLTQAGDRMIANFLEQP